jgi:hypothetical protein
MVAVSKSEVEMSSAPHWTAAEDELLQKQYPTASNAELQALFPARPVAGIRQRAHQIGVRKSLDAHENGMPFSGSVIGHLSETEKGYLAGIIDSEGCIMLARHLGQRDKHVYHLYVSMATTSLALHQWLEQRLPGAGYVRQRQRVKIDARPTSNQPQWRTGYDWIISGNRVATVLLREIAPTWSSNILRLNCTQVDICIFPRKNGMPCICACGNLSAKPKPPITVSASSSSTKPPYRARQSLSKTCLELVTSLFRLCQLAVE